MKPSTPSIRAIRALFLAAAALWALPAAAVDPSVISQIREGDALLDAGDAVGAEMFYVNAKGTAADLSDWDGMLLLSNRFFTVTSEWHAKDCYLIALQYADDLARHASGAGDPLIACTEAVGALDAVSDAWDDDLSFLPMADTTASDMEYMSQQAFDLARSYETNGCQ